MEQFRTGTPVVVEWDNGQQYAGQVMFVHHGDPQRVMVAWLYDAPPGHHDVADWVEVHRVTAAG